jgi:hypothetical protein
MGARHLAQVLAGLRGEILSQLSIDDVVGVGTEGEVSA